MAINHTRILLFFVFVASGFTGLIYESIWSHYLKLFLGHAAYAQALVLAIFMGGMAIGAWLTARHVFRWSNLLLIYAAIELIIGLFGIGFHQIFEYILSLSFDYIIPSLEHPTAVYIYKWAVGTILILPQSILLGMTFPLMSNGLIRLLPGTQGATLSMLYFCNSIGAAIGVLVSGFYLIESVGLPGTVLTAGLVNIGLAIVIYRVAKNKPRPALKPIIDSPYNFPIFFLVAAFITGVASFIYELAWIRMLSMVLGASTHSFELMLSAFITGLAFGGLWIYRRIDNFNSPIRVVGVVQILMGVFALATIPLYSFTFDLMGFFMQALGRTESSYQLFTFSSHLLALLVMLPTTFCAGMTLPLFTFILLKRGYGEKSIGYTYASNTLGAIVGVGFTIYIGLPILGLKNSIILGSSLDIILGICLIIFFTPTLKYKIMAVPALLLITSIISILLWSNFDVHRMAGGVFRHGIIKHADNIKVLFHKDGKTASISVLKGNLFNDDGEPLVDAQPVSITTNGKPEASIIMGNNLQRKEAGDEITMVLAGLIPLSIHPQTKTVANIGMGSGLTTHTLLSSPYINRVDTIEIESAMVEGANYFRPRVERAYSDARSHIYIEDAKTFFSTHNKKYDLIISEPSNPWVSGVSSLFSVEFYKRMTNYLEDDGMMVQWLNLYEISPPLIFSVLKALTSHFSNFAIYFTDNSNMLIIARNGGAVGLPKEEIFDHINIQEDLASINLNNIHDIHARFIGNDETLLPLINNYNVVTNSDYFPILDLNAPRDRFMGQTGDSFNAIKRVPLPIIKMILPGHDIIDSEKVSKYKSYQFSLNTAAARNLVHYIKNKPVITDDLTTYGVGNLEFLMRLAKTCEAHIYPEMWINNFYKLIIITVPYLQDNQLVTILNAITPDCDNKMSEQQTMWIALYKSFINTNAEEIVKYSEALLNSSDTLSNHQKQYLFSVHVLGLAVIGDPQVKSFWDKHVTQLFNNKPIPLWISMLYTLGLNNIQ